MEVREPSSKYLIEPAYQRTEAGVIPADWNTRPLGDIASVSAGGTPSRRVAEYWDGDIPWVTTTEITGGLIRETAQWITELGLVNSAAKLLAPGTLLLALYGQGKTRGKVALLAVRAATNQACAAIVVSPAASRMFVFHVLVSRYTSIRGLSNSGSQENLSGGIVKSIAIPLPPTKVEQEAIAEALSDADALIESLEQLLAKKRHLKQGAMQELLTGKRRLPGFGGEWGIKRLDEVAEIRSGGTPSTTQPHLWDGDVPWCTPTDITALNGSKYLRQTARTITAQGLKQSSAELIPANSVVMTSRATIGECAINAVPVATNQGFKNFVPFPGSNGEFLYYLLQVKKQDFISLCGGSTFLEIGKTQLGTFEVCLPNARAEQTAIAAILADMDTELAALEAKLTKARQIKQGMMAALLTGRIRLD